MPWPLSIVAPEAALAQYQMVFRHIFELKWVEREVNRVCALYQRTAGLANRRTRMRRRDSLGGGVGDAVPAALAASYSTCQVMAHFFRQYLLYVTFEVMEPLWAAFEARVQGASSLDEVSRAVCGFMRGLSACDCPSTSVFLPHSLPPALPHPAPAPLPPPTPIPTPTHTDRGAAQGVPAAPHEGLPAVPQGRRAARAARP